jgi:hypothetical protein
MLIRILRQTSISGQPARVGDLIDALPSDARLLINSGKAEEVAAAPMPPDPEPIPRPQPRARKPRSFRT